MLECRASLFSVLTANVWQQRRYPVVRIFASRFERTAQFAYPYRVDLFHGHIQSSRILRSVIVGIVIDHCRVLVEAVGNLVRDVSALSFFRDMIHIHDTSDERTLIGNISGTVADNEHSWVDLGTEITYNPASKLRAQ
jgi:hypothetical protein